MRASRLDSAPSLVLLVACLTITSVLQTEAEVCFRKFVAERRACRGRMRNHRAINSAQGCCRKLGQGYAKQPIRVNHSRNWFDCTPCRHDNVTSSEFPGDPTSSAEIRLSQHPAASAAAAADESQMTSDDVSRSFIYLNSALLNGAIGWSDWSQWSQCSASCGQGSQVRTRACKSSETDSRLCRGSNTDVRNCTRPAVHCSDAAATAVDGGWGEWSAWSECKTSCGAVAASDEALNDSQQTRSRQCDQPRPTNGGQDCVGPPTESIPCPSTPCPVDGQWSSWSEWTSCSADCGEGVETRSRACSDPTPRHGGRPCEGLELESMPCVKRTNCPVDGGWSSWSPGDVCSAAPCSGLRGHRTRFRSCTEPRPMFGGAACRGRSWKVEPCYNNEFCTDRVDGEWCEWSQWCDCNNSAVASRKRFRRCECPPPANDGESCQGNSEESKPCGSDTELNLADEGKQDTETQPDCNTSDGTDIECDLEEEQLAVDHGSAVQDNEFNSD